METSSCKHSTFNSRFNSSFQLALLGLSLSAVLATQCKGKAKTEAEIVRVSYVQGDVRFSRGDGGKLDLTKPWEQAVVNLAILKGYSVATGNGRAEIEFEYGSTVYVAENSVLFFQTLSSKDGVPSTEMELVTGTVTVLAHPIPEEEFVLLTPTERVEFPESTLARVDSYLDGATIVVQGKDSDELILSHLGRLLHGLGAPSSVKPYEYSGTPADWDSWVMARVKQREADTAAALKASGLSSFVPGLTDMYNGGTFFACAPFGTCWEPKPLQETAAASDATTKYPPSDPAEAAAGSLQLVAMHLTLGLGGGQENGEAGTQAQQPGTTPTPGAAPPAKKLKPKYSEYYYPLATCPPMQIEVVTRKDPVTGKEIEIERNLIPIADPWTWGLCHSGTWAHVPRRGRRYTFVVGKKRHHPPVHWLHTKNGDVYVPRHPSDVKGKPPLNLKYGVFEAKNGPYAAPELVNFKTTETYKVLSEAPKQFREIPFAQQASAERPEIHARFMASAVPAVRPAAKPGKEGVESSITFDYKTRKFVQAGEPVGGRTGKQVVVGGLNTHGGLSGGHSGGGRAGSGGASGGRASGSGRTYGGGSAGRTYSSGATSSGSGGGRAAAAPSSGARKP